MFGREINKELAVSSTGLTVKEAGLLYGPKSVFVYGTPAQADQWLVSKGLSAAGSEGGGSGESRTLGFTHSSRPFPNPNYVGYPENLYTEAGWINVRDIADGEWADDANINAWLGVPGSLGRERFYYEEFENDAFLAYHSSLKDSGEKISDIAYILQLPTKNSWGLAIMFHRVKWNEGSGHTAGSYSTLYSTALIKPYDLQVMSEDLDAGINCSASSAKVGENVSVVFSIGSSFIDTITAGYTITVDGIITTGTIDIPPGKTTIPYSSVTMPKHDVTVKFSVNPDGTTPPERFLSNNTAEETIRFVEEIRKTGDIELDYNILERKVKFSIGSTSAELSLPTSYDSVGWVGNATGSLRVTNNTPDIYRNFSVTNNPAVNESSSLITRNPEIHTLLRRQDFGDTPLINSDTMPVERIEKLEKTGEVSASGSVSRAWEGEHGRYDRT